MHRLKVRERIEAGIAAAGVESAAMITLTSLPGTSVEAMMRAFNRFRTWMRRRVPGIEYVAVKEWGGNTGMLHLHLIVVGWKFVRQSEISAAWKRASGAQVVDVRRLHGESGRAAGYVAKYVSKALAERDVRKIVTYSRGWPRVPRTDAIAWVPTGDEVLHGVPPGQAVVLPGGGLVAVNRGCACVEDSAEATVGQHLALRRIHEGRLLGTRTLDG